jgi:hypothetical protein
MKRTLFALALAAALPLSAQAAEGDSLSYTYFEADYVGADVTNVDNLDGVALRASAGFGTSWYATASWTRVSKGDIDLGVGIPFDIDFNQSVIGLGWHTAISDKAAFIAEAAWVRDDFEIEANSIPGSGNDGFDGYRITAGLRGKLSDRFEGEIRAHYTDFQDVDGGLGGEINGLFAINKTWGITAGWAHEDLGDDNVDQWKLGVRASY